MDPILRMKAKHHLGESCLVAVPLLLGLTGTDLLNSHTETMPNSLKQLSTEAALFFHWDWHGQKPHLHHLAWQNLVNHFQNKTKRVLNVALYCTDSTPFAILFLHLSVFLFTYGFRLIQKALARMFAAVYGLPSSLSFRDLLMVAIYPFCAAVIIGWGTI